MRKITRLLLAILTIVFFMCAFPVTALATDYTPADGDTMDISACVSGDTITIGTGRSVTLTGNSVSLTKVRIICEAGTTLTLENVIINNSGYSGDCPLTFTGAGSKLILKNGTTSTLMGGASFPGILVAAPADLTLENNGTLNVEGGTGYMGLGCAGLRCPSGAALTVSGSGTLNATGLYGGAGIGGGVKEACGAITIDSGTVVAKGGGIRGSMAYFHGISGGAITISGGTVYTGPNFGGVGGNSSEGSSISINGGDVNASGAAGAPGIGGFGSLGCDVTITGGTVTAVSNKSPAIGRNNLSASTGGRVVITGGTVVAQSYGFNNAGIDCSSSESGAITITGGTVTASGTIDGFGIRGSAAGTGTISISGGIVTATGGSGGMPAAGGTGGIGGSGISASSTGTGSVEVSGGTVYAGGGMCDLGHGILSAVDTLSITGTAMVFLQNNNCTTPPITTHTNTTYPIGTTEIYGTGISVPETWTSDFSAYLRPCALSYDTNGGSGTVPDSVTLLYGTTCTLPDGSGLSRVNYLFDGWNTAADGSGSDYAAGSTFTFTADTELYAQWIAQPALSSSVTDGKTYTGGSIVLTPNIDGGAWDWDHAFFSATFNSPATFTALKAGTSTITYTVEGQSVTYNVTIGEMLSLTSSDTDGEIYVNGRITLTPNISGGEWSYDSTYLSLSGNTFKALKAGITTVTYTAGEQISSYNITIANSELPSTGQDFTWVWVLGIAAVAVSGLACMTLLNYKRRLNIGSRK